MNEHRATIAMRVGEEVERVGLPVVVELDGDTLVLSGVVSTEADRDAVLDIAASVAANEVRVEENLTVSDILPEEMQDATLSESEVAGTPGAEPLTEENESTDPGDFSDQPTSPSYEDTQPGELSEHVRELGGDEPRVESGEEAYVPPIDPAATEDDEHVAGLQRSSLDEVAPERSSDGSIGDEAIRDAVLRELREDAATAGLDLDVEVASGIVFLRGRVDDVDDVENAEEVAARVTGVAQVIEQLEAEGFDRR